jgi:hypothetical protein
VEDLIFMAKPSKLIGGTMTLFHGSVTSAPLRFNASQKTIDRTFAELVKEDAAVQAMRKKRARR